jgi:hypothetical protein
MPDDKRTFEMCALLSTGTVRVCKHLNQEQSEKANFVGDKSGGRDGTRVE